MSIWFWASVSSGVNSSCSSMAALLPGPTDGIALVRLQGPEKAACAEHPRVYSTKWQSRRTASHRHSASAATAAVKAITFAQRGVVAYSFRGAAALLQGWQHRQPARAPAAHPG